MVKGQCKIYFLPFVSCIVLLWHLNFALLSPPLLLIYLCYFSVPSLLDLGPVSVPFFLHFFTPLSVSYLTFPVSSRFSNGKELQFVFLCFPVFSAPLWQRSAWLLDSLWGLFPLTFKCAKISDCFLQAVCVSNIRSLLSSRGMQFITLTES